MESSSLKMENEEFDYEDGRRGVEERIWENPLGANPSSSKTCDRYRILIRGLPVEEYISNIEGLHKLIVNIFMDNNYSSNKLLSETPLIRRPLPGESEVQIQLMKSDKNSIMNSYKKKKFNMKGRQLIFESVQYLNPNAKAVRLPEEIGKTVKCVVSANLPKISLPYLKQLDHKSNHGMKIFKIVWGNRFKDFPFPKWNEIIPAPMTDFYATSIAVTLFKDEKTGKIHSGLKVPFNKMKVLVPLENHKTVPEKFVQITKTFISWSQKPGNLTVCERKSRNGEITGLLLQMSSDEKAVMTVLVVHSDHNESDDMPQVMYGHVKEKMEAFFKDHGAEHSIQNIYARPDKNLHNAWTRTHVVHITGSEVIEPMTSNMGLYVEPTRVWSAPSRSHATVVHTIIKMADIGNKSVVIMVDELMYIPFVFAQKVRDVIVIGRPWGTTGQEKLNEAVKAAGLDSEINFYNKVQPPEINPNRIKGSTVILWSSPSYFIVKLERLLGMGAAKVVFVCLGTEMIHKVCKDIAKVGLAPVEVTPIDTQPHTANFAMVLLFKPNVEKEIQNNAQNLDLAKPVEGVADQSGEEYEQNLVTPNSSHMLNKMEEVRLLSRSVKLLEEIFDPVGKVVESYLQNQKMPYSNQLQMKERKGRTVVRILCKNKFKNGPIPSFRKIVPSPKLKNYATSIIVCLLKEGKTGKVYGGLRVKYAKMKVLLPLEYLQTMPKQFVNITNGFIEWTQQPGNLTVCDRETKIGDITGLLLQMNVLGKVVLTIILKAREFRIPERIPNETIQYVKPKMEDFYNKFGARLEVEDIYVKLYDGNAWSNKRVVHLFGCKLEEPGTSDMGLYVEPTRIWSSPSRIFPRVVTTVIEMAEIRKDSVIILMVEECNYIPFVLAQKSQEVIVMVAQPLQSKISKTTAPKLRQAARDRNLNCRIHLYTEGLPQDLERRSEGGTLIIWETTQNTEVQGILEMGITKVIVVCLRPETIQKMCRNLENLGLIIAEVTPIDTAPHTPYFGLVLLFKVDERSSSPDRFREEFCNDRGVKRSPDREEYEDIERRGKVPRYLEPETRAMFWDEGSGGGDFEGYNSWGEMMSDNRRSSLMRERRRMEPTADRQSNRDYPYGEPPTWSQTSRPGTSSSEVRKFESNCVGGQITTEPRSYSSERDYEHMDNFEPRDNDRVFGARDDMRTILPSLSMRNTPVMEYTLNRGQNVVRSNICRRDWSMDDNDLGERSPRRDFGNITLGLSGMWGRINVGGSVQRNPVIEVDLRSPNLQCSTERGNTTGMITSDIVERNPGMEPREMWRSSGMRADEEYRRSPDRRGRGQREEILDARDNSTWGSEPSIGGSMTSFDMRDRDSAKESGIWRREMGGSKQRNQVVEIDVRDPTIQGSITRENAGTTIGGRINSALRDSEMWVRSPDIDICEGSGMRNSEDRRTSADRRGGSSWRGDFRKDGNTWGKGSDAEVRDFSAAERRVSERNLNMGNVYGKSPGMGGKSCGGHEEGMGSGITKMWGPVTRDRDHRNQDRRNSSSSRSGDHDVGNSEVWERSVTETNEYRSSRRISSYSDRGVADREIWSRTVIEAEEYRSSREGGNYQHWTRPSTRDNNNRRGTDGGSQANYQSLNQGLIRDISPGKEEGTLYPDWREEGGELSGEFTSRRTVNVTSEDPWRVERSRQNLREGRNSRGTGKGWRGPWNGRQRRREKFYPR